MLEIRNLSKEFENGVRAVDNLSLTINPGQIYCMLGANGAGKTTTVNMIFNFMNPTAGHILVNGIDVYKNPREAKMNLAYVSENVMLYENFTAIQNLDFFTRISGNKEYAKEDYEKILLRVGFPKEANNRRVKTFSKGMRQKCGIAIAIAKNADNIILDEPTSGLDPRSGMEFMKILEELRKDNKSILMTTHDIFRAKTIADKIGIMANGHLLREISQEEVKDIDLEMIYLKYIER
jgi:ABC-2 type transport system ATP-binding protein